MVNRSGVAGGTRKDSQLLGVNLTLAETDSGSVSSPESDTAGVFISLSYIMDKYPGVKLFYFFFSVASLFQHFGKNKIALCKKTWFYSDTKQTDFSISEML